MTAPLRRLLVLHEPEAACRARLEANGTPADVAAEIAFYLAQATDFAAMREPIAAALAHAGIELLWEPLDAHARWLPHLQDPGRDGLMLWCLTDGFAWYRGSLASSLGTLLDVPLFGSPPATQHLCQDKFRCLMLAQGAGLAIPATALIEDREPLTPLTALPPAGPYFVKPNTLGAKLGIGSDSKAASLGDALALSRRIWQRYGDRALIQAYVPGRDIRVSFLDLGDPPRLGLQAIRTSGHAGFPTLADSTRMTRLADAGSVDGLRLDIEDLSGSPAAAGIEAATRRLARVASLRDYFSLDFRLAQDGTPWFLEFEVCPAVTIYDFRTYLRTAFGQDLPEALARAVPLAHAKRRAGERPVW